MKTRARTVLWSGTFCAVAATFTLREHDVTWISFDIGQNIVETAKKSGAPRFSTRNIAGYVSYALIDLPSDIPAHYSRPGYEIKAVPLFAFTLYSDKEQDDRLLVETAALQLDTDALQSHQAAKTYVQNLIEQFHSGKWTRHIDDLCPAVTGRSSYLNEAGNPEQIETCPLDPDHRISDEDWVRLMRMTQTFEWLGDGILAKLTVGYSDDDIRGITYSIDLEFNNFEIMKRRRASNLARDLAHGDAQGWNSTVSERNSISALRSRINVLEENARKRGDTVLPRLR